MSAAALLLLSSLLTPPAAGLSAERPIYIVQLEGGLDRSPLVDVERRQSAFLAAAAAALERTLAPRFRYRAAFNGMALALSDGERSKLAHLPGVVAIHPNRAARLASDAGPAWIGAGGIWDGSQTGGLPGTQGEGIVIGIIDGAVDPQHPSFADVGADGYDHVNPRGAGNYLGWCDPAHPRHDPALGCNDKLIGIWFPESCSEAAAPSGHGSHVASVAAGNHVAGATLDFPTTTISRDIAGVAPHANLAVYSGCSATPWYDEILAAIDQAVLDGVNVLNCSLAIESFVQPWDDPLALALLGAREAGIFVAVPAPPWTVPSSSTGPWTVTVGVSTHDRTFENALTDFSGGGAPPPDLPGRAWSGPYGPAPIVHASSFGVPFCTSPFPAGTFSGEIVVCDHQDPFWTNPITQGEIVRASGAGGLVLTDVSPDAWRVSEEHELPAVHLALAEANLLRSWLSAASGHTVAIAGTSPVSDPQNGDVVAESGRGPTFQIPWILKPDLVAPGVEIFGAWTGGDDYAVLSGSSASVAFTSGAAALLLALHPDWTPSVVHSALATTAATGLLDGRDGDPADPFDRGSGRIDLSAAARTGLLLDETAANFASANPDLGGHPSALNLPSLVCRAYQQCRWTRAVRNALAATAEWDVSWTAPPGASLTVTPASFTLAPGATQEIEVVADALSSSWSWNFGELLLTERTAAAPPAKLPIAVRWEQQYQLAVQVAGSGEGRVTSVPPGIDCGADCAEPYLFGDSVTLTATPEPGSLFMGWAANPWSCSWEPQCRIFSVDQDFTLTAYFVPVPPDVQLQDGKPHPDVLDPPAETSAWKYYSVDVEAGSTPLVVDLFLDDGGHDVGLYLRFGEKPNGIDDDCQDAYGWASTRRCSGARTQTGRWWIGVHKPNWGTARYSVRARWETTGTHFFTLTPCRLLDTRDTSTPLQSGVPRTIETFFPCGIPPYATALSANVTAVAPTASGHFTFYQGNGPPPGTSTLNFRFGQVRANNTILALDPLTAAFKALATLADGGQAHLLVDVNGYFR